MAATRPLLTEAIYRRDNPLPKQSRPKRRDLKNRSVHVANDPIHQAFPYRDRHTAPAKGTTSP